MVRLYTLYTIPQLIARADVVPKTTVRCDVHRVTRVLTSSVGKLQAALHWPERLWLRGQLEQFAFRKMMLK